MPDKFFLLCFLTLLVIPISLKAESCVMIADTEGVLTPTLVDEGRFYTLEPAFEDYYFMLEDACDAWDISTDNGCDIFPLMGAIQWNAVAAICDGNKVIVYDRRLSLDIGYEGAQAVFAHELGHHICNHIGIKSADVAESRNRELAADRFAGATMRRIGLSRESALGYLPFLMELPSESHPGKSEREAALLAGWDDPKLATQCLTPER